MYKGTLKLSDYKWNLKSFETGDLLATQYFMISSEGEAMKEYSDIMGRYTLSQKIVMNCPPHYNVPVYKKDGGNFYLYLNSSEESGDWLVSDVVGYSAGYLQQLNLGGEPAPSPLQNLPWQYSSNGWKDDDTLKVYPCYY